MLRPFVAVAQAFLGLSLVFGLSFAAPAQGPEPQPHALSKRADKPSQGQIDTANGMFPGIDWSYTAEQGGCDSGQFAVLVESTRMALELMKFTGEDLRVAYDTTGFNRYFMRHQEWFKLRIWEFAIQKYFGVYKWPTTTPKRNTREWKTVYWCTEPSWMKNHCGSANKPPAYTPTVNPATGGSPDPTYPYANSVIFCPRFWTSEFQYVNDITEKPGRELRNIDDLHSYEHVLIHEWFHNAKNDVGKWHVVDMKGDYGDGFTRNIYGSYACQHYAWRHVLKGGGVGDIEFQTMSNADSWAWMISYNWFKSIYNWRDDGSMKPTGQLKGRDDEDPEEETDPYKDLPLDEDAVDDSTISDQEGNTLPEATTYNRDDCPNCLITEGGCVAVPECRYPQANGTVDPACTHCTCDIDKTDNSPSTEDLSLPNDKCAGWTGTLPEGYVWPPFPTPSSVPNDFNCNCGESGCSADSAPCCANGSCKCTCGESGCAAGDPACCASGTCHFGTMRMLF